MTVTATLAIVAEPLGACAHAMTMGYGRVGRRRVAHALAELGFRWSAAEAAFVSGASARGTAVLRIACVDSSSGAVDIWHARGVADALVRASGHA
jgi:hypothetical protein